MSDPAVRRAWAARLRGWLPDRASDVLALGCGAADLPLLAAELGHRVTVVEPLSRTAVPVGTGVRVVVGEAARPPLAERRFDAVLAHSVLRTVADPAAALSRWAELVRPAGRLVVLEEGGPGGVPAAALAELAASLASYTHVEQLGRDPRSGEGRAADAHYAAVIHPAPPRRHAEIVDVHLILRRADSVLLARRSNTGYADGLWNAPSGHVEDGEDVRTAMIREAYEEIGVVIDPADLRVALVMQHRAPNGSARTGWFFEALRWSGKAVNREPHKCAGIEWFELDALPDDMVAYCRAGVDAYRAGDRFVLHWHHPGDSIGYRPRSPGRAVVLPHNEPDTRPSQPAGDRT
ncbi:NUDIX domain-containing protein [Streptantibioticus rubrisoli]|uniref:NUDIX domain-containing protein n=1 Tax=Streptantibioticus rubrisoli TaxID=1387313 RepID=A0ABT1P8Q1_9ACTN|nr:NUDIX domain-containing protein [Streptantibioticus rubrisoli]MCQ4041742.1 NUDIX domain-containing protein [Streptantibioticus rubrisoli]